MSGWFPQIIAYEMVYISSELVRAKHAVNVRRNFDLQSENDAYI